MSEPSGVRILELRLKNTLTGDAQVSRIKIELPSTRYAAHLKQKWVDVTDGLTPEEIAAVPMPSRFDGA